MTKIRLYYHWDVYCYVLDIFRTFYHNISPSRNFNYLNKWTYIQITKIFIIMRWFKIRCLVLFKHTISQFVINSVLPTERREVENICDIVLGIHDIICTPKTIEGKTYASVEVIYNLLKLYYL